ncbi:MAG TPA: hypothetical protein IAB62_08305 [Candidatus Coprocola pullicola]|nr:hypothetical protein [Candidatus Coprocola pullicola]
MRTENSVKNSIAALVSNAFIMFLGFAIQTIFVKTLGEEYLGINGLFNNIISMLAIVELGIGPAIVSNLYKPLAENNYAQIKSLLGYYRKCYNLIGILVIGVGLLIMPFIKFFVKTEITFKNFGGIYFIYILFILDASFSYFYSYKRSIIQADQKNRIINITHLICYTVMIILQIAILVVTQNYILFLIVKIIFRLLENIILSVIVDKKYRYLKGPAEKMKKEEKQNIFTKVKGLIYHKVGGYLVLGTDNLIISAFLGVGLVGLYSNYYLIINSLYVLYCQIFSALTASVGNLIATESREANYTVYKKIVFLNFWIYGFSAAALYCMMTPFITFWLGEEFLLSNNVLIVLVVNFYMLGMRSSIGTFKDAAGIFYEDRFIPIIESVINVIASLILVQFLGILGVFIGTFLSSLIVVFYSLPHFVFQRLFGQKKMQYYKLYFKYALITFIGVLTTILPYRFISLTAGFPNIIMLLIATVLSAIIPNVIFILFLKNTEEFQYFKEIALAKLNKGRKH